MNYCFTVCQFNFYGKEFLDNLDKDNYNEDIESGEDDDKIGTFIINILFYNFGLKLDKHIIFIYFYFIIIFINLIYF